MSNVHPLVPAVDCAALVAEGLEQTAREIREGRLSPHQAIVVLRLRHQHDDMVGAHFYGADASSIELVGLLELAKKQAIEGG